MTDLASRFDRALAEQTTRVARDIADSYERRRLLGDELAEEYGLIGDQGFRLACAIYEQVENFIKQQATEAGRPIAEIPDKVIADVVDAMRPQWQPMITDAKRASDVVRVGQRR